MKNIKSISFITGIIFTVLGIIKFYPAMKYHTFRLKGYDTITVKNSLQGVIIHKDQEYSYPYLILQDSAHIILDRSSNFNYKPYRLFDFLQLGDSIYKKRNNDTLEIFRNNLKYYFLLGKDIRQ